MEARLHHTEARLIMSILGVRFLKMVLSGLKGTFFLIIIAATIFTLFSFFTPGWRFYNHDYNEGIVIKHLGDVSCFHVS
jgi:hypothetical protein